MLAHIFKQESKRELMKFPGSISSTLCAISVSGRWSWLQEELHAIKVMPKIYMVLSLYF